MKLHFESDLTYQQNAITSVCDLFEGQEKWEKEMTVLALCSGALSFEGATGSMPVNPQIPEDDVLLKTKQCSVKTSFHLHLCSTAMILLSKWKQGQVKRMFIFAPCLS